MNTPVRLAIFFVGLLAVFGAAVGVGSAVGPVGPVAPPTDQISPADQAPDPSHEEHTP